MTEFDESLLDRAAAGSDRDVLAAGDVSTLFIDAEGTLWHLGQDVDGQVMGPTAESGGPYVAVSTRGNTDTHVCAIDGQGALFCWGGNIDGQLGLGDLDFRDAPTLVGPAGWSDVSVGFVSTCGVRDGMLLCWGWNGNHRLGVDGVEQYEVPTQITADQDWRSVALSSHACGIRGDAGRLECWGANDAGQLGRSDAATMGAVQPADGWRSVAVTRGHTCAIDTMGQLWCWGDNSSGQVDGTPSGPVTAPKMIDARLWTQVRCGGAHSCGVTEGQIHCWGANDQGQLGNGSMGGSTAMQRVGDRSDWVAIATGSAHSCAVNAADELWCWGLNEHYQLGLTQGSAFDFPQRVTLGP